MPLFLAFWFSACALEEVTIPLGQEVLVVQGVLSLDSNAGEQIIVVERSLTGTIDAPDQDSLRAPPRPPLPVSNALVVVTRDDGDSAVFLEDLSIPGTYRACNSCLMQRGFLLPGRIYSLRVTVPDGRVVTGRMRMPDFPQVGGLPPDSTFNRDRDSMRIAWSGGGSTKGVFVQVRPMDLARRLTLFFFTDSLNFRLAGTQPLPFVNDTLPPVVWVAGTRQIFTVAAIDTNLFDFTRSGNEPFTGGGFINTIEGALGVFGGIAPVNVTYEVIGDVDHPWEGRYHLEGGSATDTISGDIDLFVTDVQPERVLVSGIFRNTRGNIDRLAEASGRVENGRLRLAGVSGVILGQTGRFQLEGDFVPGGTTTGTLRRGPNTIGGFRLTRLP